MITLDKLKARMAQQLRLLHLPANLYLQCPLYTKAGIPRPREEYRLLFTAKDKEAGPRKILSAR